MAPIVIIVAALAGGVAAKTLHPQADILAGHVKQIGDWWVACDNVGECTVMGFPERNLSPPGPGQESADMAIQVALFGPEFPTAPAVHLIPVVGGALAPTADGQPAPFVFDMHYGTADCTLAATLDGGLAPTHGYARHQLPDYEVPLVLRQLSDCPPLTGRRIDREGATIRFPYLGAAEALRAAHSARLHLTRRAASEAAREAPPAVRLTAEPVMVSGTAALSARNSCPDGRTRNAERFALGDGASLWVYECAAEPAGSRRRYAMSASGEGAPQPVALPDPRDGPVAAGAVGLVHSSFDWDFGIVRAYEFAGENEDCGIFRAWAYTQSGWLLIERRDMPVCRGLQPTEWIRTHYVPTRTATES